MSLTLDNLGISDEEKKFIYTIFENNLIEQGKKEIGLDEFIDSSIYLFNVDVVCKKLGITEEELLERLNDLYKMSININNIRMHVIHFLVGFKINE